MSHVVLAPDKFKGTLTAEQVAYSKFSDDLKISDVILSSMTWESTMSLADGYSVRANVLNGVSTSY